MSESEQQELKLNLYQRINEVMKDIDYLQKDDAIKFASTNYKAISEEKVTSTVRASLIKNGLVILPVEQEHKRDGTLTTVDTKYKIVDIFSGQSEILASSGTGVDSQDKGVGKAMTYSYKYLLLRTFAIPTGEDPDRISNAEIEDKQRKQQNKSGQQQSQPQNNNNQGNNNTPNPISEGQVKAMNTNLNILKKEANTTSDKLIVRLEKEVGKFGSVSGMTKQQATQGITLLKKWTEATKASKQEG